MKHLCRDGAGHGNPPFSKARSTRSGLSSATLRRVRSKRFTVKAEALLTIWFGMYSWANSGLRWASGSLRAAQFKPPW
jgi:hypothetical protein